MVLLYIHTAHPIIQGGMHHVGLSPLAGAVSKAGGLGMITALSCGSPENLRSEIKKARTIAGEGKPIGVNLTLLPTLVPPNYDAYAQVVVDEKIPVIETAGSAQGLQPFVDLFKREGRIVIHKCTTVRHAKSATKMGVDIISMDGYECAGHPTQGTEVGNFVLAPQAAKELTIPFVVSGGVATGSQLVASLSMGAIGINMGTRFMATREAPIHQNIKNAIVKGTIDDTALIMKTMKNTERVFANAAAKEVLRIEKEFPGDFSKVKHLVAGSVYKKVFQETGDVDNGIWSAGLSMALIDNIPTCEELMNSMVKEAIDIITNTLKGYVVEVR
jgi:NAD(P)H-dependent flavin oxidoreductase YrpB (nitropropane dioxygenase family)